MTESPVLSRTGMFLFPWGKVAPSAETLLHLAGRSDELGLDSVHFPYFFNLPADEWPWGNRSLLDALAMLPSIAARTERVKLCLSHWNFSMLHPYIWAQYLSSLSVAAGGRAMTTLTLGKREADFQVGMSKPEEAEARFEEGFSILRTLLSGAEVPEGATELWDAAGLRIDPAPKDPMTIWINGSSAQTIQCAARWADYLKPSGQSPQQVREQTRPALDKAAQEQGRTTGLAMSLVVFVVDPEDSQSWLRDSIAPLLAQQCPGRSAGAGYIYGPPEDCAAQIVDIMQAGVDYLALDLHFHGWATHELGLEQLNRFAERVAPLISAGDIPERGR
jgi:alkanesulfonate monooxygenase SsuD/methylene tetrahydromethanopterin reductase-like flavin-dependent oxidoreductase (luciferase family)